MSQGLDDLVNLLTLEPIEENLFRGSNTVVIFATSANRKIRFRPQPV